jgi:hypothetical protein
MASFICLQKISIDRKKAISEMRKVILKNLPKGFEEVMSFGMIGWRLANKPSPCFCWAPNR